jgi:hypothetical protein
MYVRMISDFSYVTCYCVTQLWWLIYAMSYFRFFASKCENVKTRRDDKFGLCRLFAFSVFPICEATKRKYDRKRAKILHTQKLWYIRIPSVVSSHFCFSALLHFRIFAFLLFALLNFRIVTFSHLRVPVAHANGDINKLL